MAPRNRHSVQINDDINRCSAWIDGRNRCCQRLISKADRKKRDGLLLAAKAPGGRRDATLEAAKLYFCNGWHRPGGKYPVDSSAVKSISSLLQKCAPSGSDGHSRASVSRLPRSPHGADSARIQSSPTKRQQGHTHAEGAPAVRRSPRFVAQQRDTAGQPSQAHVNLGSRVRRSERIATRRGMGPRDTTSSTHLDLPAQEEDPTSTTDGLEHGTSQHQVVPPASAPPSLSPQRPVPPQPPQLRRSDRIRASHVSANNPPLETSRPSAATTTRRPHTFGRCRDDNRIGTRVAARIVEEDEECPICFEILGSEGPSARCNFCTADYHLACLTWWIPGRLSPSCPKW